MFSLVIPTYNERENIELLIAQISKILADFNYEILIVDDNSPDGTWQIVQKLQKTYPVVRLIRRQNMRGLSSAVIEGFQQARGDVLGVMDADHSHDVRLLRKMVELIQQEKADCVIGSRRISGGGADQWPFYRKWLSNLATFSAHICTEIQVKDPMSGYFCIHQKLYEEAKAQVRPKGYKILLELLVKSSPQKVMELPYVFVNRRQGYSKLSLQVVRDYLEQLLQLALFRLQKRI